MAESPKAIVFDVGGVLLDWNPRYLYRKLIDDENTMEQFLKDVTTSEWNVQSDLGRSHKQGCEELSAKFPHLTELIHAYDLRWQEMVPRVFEHSVELLMELDQAGWPIYGLTNFNQLKFAESRQRWSFFDAHFDGFVVSGEINLAKPDPKIYQHLEEKFGIKGDEIFFIDDVSHNIETAQSRGWQTILFEGENTTKKVRELLLS